MTSATISKILTNNNTMNNDQHDITPGQDKFEPIDNSLLRLHIDDLSRPIRRSIYAPSPNRRQSDGITASLVVALLIFATTAVVIWLTK